MSKVSIVEKFISSKTDRANDCEDALSIGEDFLAVIDGATSKTERKWKGQTPGQTAAHVLADAVQKLPSSSTAREAVDFLTDAINETYELYNLKQMIDEDPTQRISASIAVFSRDRREVWIVGDCQAIVGDVLFSAQKAIDKLLSDARSLFLEIEIAKGTPLEELLSDDVGREFILPLLQRQTFLQNDPSFEEYWYPVLDGSPVPQAGIKVLPVPKDVDRVVLATDGYPYLRDNLEQSEVELHRLLTSDPLLFREFKSTKGMRRGDHSFDDRAYIRMMVGR